MVSSRRRSHSGLISLLAAFGMVGAMTPVSAQPDVDSDAAYVTDHVLVELEPGFRAMDLEDSEPVLGRWHVVPVEPGEDLAEKIEELASEPGVAQVAFDYIVHIDPEFSLIPLGHTQPMAVNDPLFPFQWHFPQVQVPAAWPQSMGAGVVVAVLDSGVSREGEDLTCHTFVKPYNAITATPGSSAANDDHGHGTHVAGTVAQCTNNGIGVAGVAFEARLMPVKVLDSNGSGTTSWLASGIQWAHANGADVINMSLGCDGCPSSAMVNQAIEAAAADGVVLVAAGGNANATSVAYPASHPDVIAVGAVDFNKVRAPYSNRGSALDLVAPGGDLNQDANGDGQPDGVLQETFKWDDGNKAFKYYFSAGTSMAAPHVSGAAALMLSYAPHLDREALQTILEATAEDLGPPGHDPSYGHGLIQVHDALEYLTRIPTWPASAELRVRTYGETSLEMRWDAASDSLGITGYRLRLIGTGGVFFPGTSGTISGLQPGTEYQFEVQARNLAGNWSQPLTATVRTARHFSDMAGHLFSGDVRWLSGRDITRGCNPPANDRFCPDEFVTRSQMAAFVVRAWGLKADTHPGFDDVPAGSTFAGDIGRLATAGITRGCNPPANDRFCPEDFVTRGQMAAFFHRAPGG
jgi:subtilisin family serine protease